MPEGRVALLQPPKDENGKETSDDLSPQGYFRAANLHQVFGRGNTKSGYNTPDVIYAMKSQPVRPSIRASAHATSFLPVTVASSAIQTLCRLWVVDTIEEGYVQALCCICCTFFWEEVTIRSAQCA